MNSELRRIRKGKRISGTEVAQVLGVSPQHYYDIEKGKNGLSAENAIKLAEIFDVSLYALLGREQPEPGPLPPAEDWTDEELREIENFKSYLKSKRAKGGYK